MSIQAAPRTAACVCLLAFSGVISGPVLGECDTSFPQLVGFDFSPTAVSLPLGVGGGVGYLA